MQESIKKKIGNGNNATILIIGIISEFIRMKTAIK